MKRITGGIIFAASVTATAAASFGSWRGMEGAYQEEARTDMAKAAAAQTYLDSHDEVVGQIEGLIRDKQAQMDHVADVIGSKCMDKALGVKPATIEAVVEENGCALGKDALKQTARLYHGFEDDMAGLLEYVEPSGYRTQSIADEAVEGAAAAIKDGNDASLAHDLSDTPYSAVALRVEGDQVIATYSDNGPYDLLDLIGYGIGTSFCAVIAGGSAKLLRGPSQLTPNDAVVVA